MDNTRQRQMILVARKLKLGNPENAVDYWRTKTPQERIDALEQLRSEYYLWKGDVQSGFPRVYKIIKR